MVIISTRWILTAGNGAMRNEITTCFDHLAYANLRFLRTEPDCTPETYGPVKEKCDAIADKMVGWWQIAGSLRTSKLNVDSADTWSSICKLTRTCKRYELNFLVLISSTSPLESVRQKTKHVSFETRIRKTKTKSHNRDIRPSKLGRVVLFSTLTCTWEVDSPATTLLVMRYRKTKRWLNFTQRIPAGVRMRTTVFMQRIALLSDLHNFWVVKPS